MKQIYFLTVFVIASFCMPAYGQLKVYQNGNASVKSADSTSTVALSIGSKTYANTYSVYLSSNNPSQSTYNIGAEGFAMPSTAQTTGRAIGVRGVAGNCATGYNTSHTSCITFRHIRAETVL